MRASYSQVLSTKGSDAEKWQSLVNKYHQGDIFFTAQYAMAFEASKGETKEVFGGEAFLFFYGNEQNYIIYPFFKRRISELPFCSMLGSKCENWFDIASPYGYSGPLAYVREPELEERLWQEFWKQFHNHCIRSGIVTEFARLHPYFKNSVPLSKLTNADIAKRSEVVYIELEQHETLIRKNMSKGNRSSVSKARRSGVEIRCSNSKDELDAFYQLYVATMERNEAKRAYFFAREFVDDTFQLLGENVKLFTAWHKDQPLAASLFLFKGNLAHYYLSGSNADFLYLCPNNLLLYEAILWAKERGYKILNLGGGNEPNDSLFQFKSSFSKTTAGFYTYGRLHKGREYKELCEARERYEKLSRGNMVQFDQFPRYRRIRGENDRQE